jgi:hypothetical protein
MPDVIGAKAGIQNEQSGFGDGVYPGAPGRE